MATHISEKVYNYCTDRASVSAAYARAPDTPPGKIAATLYGPGGATGDRNVSVLEPKASKDRAPATPEDLERAYQCGRFGDTRPSELFLRAYHDALLTLEHDPLMGCVSPSLMGSRGCLPLSIVGSIVDVCRHMSNLIARAEREVFLATNFWLSSESSLLICDAVRELSRRAGGRGVKAVVKIIYDRGHIKQLVDNHTLVPEESYSSKAVNMPHPLEIPNVDLQVMNYHRPMLGTFHSKFMVVDRKIAIISSNNIQSNDNCEMATHLEGPIVDSFYDLCLISWDKKLDPPLPLHNKPNTEGEYPTFQLESFLSLFDSEGKVRTANGNVNVRKSDGTETQNIEREKTHTGPDPHWDDSIADEIARVQSGLSVRGNEKKMDRVAIHLNEATHLDLKATAPECDPAEDMTPLIPHAPHEPFPIALVNRKPWGAPNHACVNTPQNEAWLSCIRNAKSSVFIQTPNLNAEPLLPELLAACRRGITVVYYVCLGYNDAGELLPFQGGTNEMVSSKLYAGLEKDERKNLHVHFYVGKDQTKPIHNKFKKRSCHIKLMVVDEYVGIQGNGNQDTQSWYHSQEANIMIDSPTICKAWLDGIRRNQNTHLYGAVSQEDGVWRDENGKEAEGAIGKNPGKFAWATGIVGAIERVRGAGGF
ncbi:uncharacterized protein BDZ99DRAFT_511749 [Mytilinidion resinicola]|uniref:PLD phosphodiesterase domain-containing protein n=1 Tax=Mytilinidion resinicola TaxID=574789 RepID=A0A6A6Y567_9PEZI|nr:uncharacterized protein BDZ99DRAFT_511749 [Mytilinidion resinicola]KAF2803956.1 hypothetical protein BDZ99DRAFT_511749 [Mytilinidion resinicola]